MGNMLYCMIILTGGRNMVMTMSGAAAKLRIYMDVYSVLEVGLEVAEDKEGAEARQDNVVHFRNLLKLAASGRAVDKIAVAANGIAEAGFLHGPLHRWAATGTVIQKLECESSSVVSYRLGLEMLRDMANLRRKPGVAVFITGAGADFDDNSQMGETMQAMCDNGWHMEVLSWRSASNPKMVRWAEENGMYIALEDFYNNITYSRYRVEKDLDSRVSKSMAHVRH